MSKSIFLKEVERLFAQHQVDEAAKQYLEVFKKPQPKSQSNTKRANECKDAIVGVLSSTSKALSRDEIADKLEGTLTVNSISAYANQLIEAGVVSKKTERYAKGRTQVVYSLAV